MFARHIASCSDLPGPLKCTLLNDVMGIFYLLKCVYIYIYIFETPCIHKEIQMRLNMEDA
jgi:hypothetical protein